MDLRGQPKTRQTPSGKPRFEVKGHPKFKTYLDDLRSSSDNRDIQLLKRIEEAISLLQENPKAGEDISRDRWPKKYRSLPNLHRYRLDDTHRMLYSITKIPDTSPFVWIIEAMDYSRYKRLFGYD
jgi:hypothetical protein